MIYLKDRRHAGQLLADALKAYLLVPDVLILALPRGGVPVAYEVATQLKAPLDVFIVRKLGAPGQKELAIGAIASGGGQVLNVPLIEDLGLSAAAIETIAKGERQEIERRELFYRPHGRPYALSGKTVILVDDGMATGSTMSAAVQALLYLKPKQLVCAVPVAAVSACKSIAPLVDDLVCLFTTKDFYSVGQWYEDFEQTSDQEVRRLLQAAGSFETDMRESRRKRSGATVDQ